MRFRYSIDFLCGIAVFADFFGVLRFWVPPDVPLLKLDVLPARNTQNSYTESAC